MKGLSAFEAKRAAPKASAPKPKVEFKYTVDGQLYTLQELIAAVRKIDADVGESKIRARLARGYRSMEKLAAGTLPPYKPKMGLRGSHG